MPPPPLLWVSPTGQEQRSLEPSKKALESPLKEQDMMVSMNQVLQQPTEVSRVTSGNCETPLEGTKKADNGKEPQESTQEVKKSKPDNPSVKVEKSNLDQTAALKAEKGVVSPTLSTASGPLSDSGCTSALPKKTVLPALANLGCFTAQPSAPPPAVVSQQLSQVL